MSLNRSAKYQLLFTQLNFSNNIAFLKRLAQSIPALEIPYLDYLDSAESTLEAFDSYIYLLDQDGWREAYTDLQRKHPKLTATHIGAITGEQALKMVDAATDQRRAESAPNDYFKILSGPMRNLVVQLDRVEGETAHVHHTLLKERRDMTLPITNLGPSEAPPSATEGFTNLLDQNQAAGNKRAIVVDGSYALYRAMFGYSTMYTRAGSKFVGGAFGFYFTMLELKELYPEYEIHVVFDGWDERKMTENPEYKALRISNTPKFKQAFHENREWIKAFIKAAGFYLYHPDDKEADDVIGSIVGWLRNQKYQHVYIYSLDTDFRQLLGPTVEQICPKQNFRGFTERVTAAAACAEFGINSINKVNWYRAVAGDSSDNIPTINMFYKSQGHRVPTIERDDYLPFVNAAKTFDEYRQTLADHATFAHFVAQGQFDKNFKLLTINTSLFDSYVSLDMHKGEFSVDEIAKLLEQFCFFKELEMLERNARILGAVW